MLYNTTKILSLIALLSFTGCWNSTSQKVANSTTETENKDAGLKDEAKFISLIKSESEFESFIKGTSKINIVKLEAPWCSACNKLHPIVLDAAKNTSEFTFAKLNIDVLPQIAQQYKIVGIPTLLLFKEGQELAESRIVGPDVQTGVELLNLIKQSIAKTPEKSA